MDNLDFEIEIDLASGRLPLRSLPCEWHSIVLGRPSLAATTSGRYKPPHINTASPPARNLDGRGAVGTEGRARSDYVPGNCGYYAIADQPLPASRRARRGDPLPVVLYTNEQYHAAASSIYTDVLGAVGAVAALMSRMIGGHVGGDAAALPGTARRRAKDDARKMARLVMRSSSIRRGRA